MSRDIIKDPYIFELAGLQEKIVERDIENAMLEQIKTVLLELGKGFSFVGNQYRISTPNSDYAHDTTPEMFVTSLFPDKFKEIATQCYLENADSYKKLFSDTEFYQRVMEAMARELYKSLRKD